MILYTTGYTGPKTRVGIPKAEALRDMVTRFDATLFDIRMAPYSRCTMWRKPELEILLRDRYVHVRELGNVNYKILAPIRIANIEMGIARVLDSIRRTNRAAILMCGCQEYATCHRRTVAHAIAAAIGGVRVFDILQWDTAEPVGDNKNG